MRLVKTRLAGHCVFSSVNPEVINERFGEETRVGNGFHPMVDEYLLRILHTFLFLLFYYFFHDNIEEKRLKESFSPTALSECIGLVFSYS